MNDTPGWASPGSAPSDGPGDRRPDDDRPNAPEGAAEGAPEGSPQDAPQDPSGQDSKWSAEQPPPAQWSAPSGGTGAGSGSGQAPPPPPAPGQGWGTPPPGGPGPQQGWGGQGGPGTGGPGWGGGYGGWGAWQGKPSAAKPGVIPLRPLGVGEILDGAVSTMRAHWRTVLGISLAVAVLTEILVVLLQGFLLNDAASSDALQDPDASARDVLDAMTGVFIGSGVVQIITLLGTIIATALLTTVTSRAVLGKSVTLGEAWRDARPQVLRLLGLTLLLPLIAAAVVFVCTVPGILVGVLGSSDAGIALAVLGGLVGLVLAIWLMIRFSLASPALMLEKQTVRKAMGRSVKLVRGSWWRVFGIQILASLIAGVVASIVLVPFTVIAGVISGDGMSGFLDSGGDAGWAFLIISGIGAVVGSTITFPITAGVTVLLYIDQRIRREALDLELARAAGLPGYGDAPGTTPGS
ncbi:hypothetical protein GTW43_29525 [Streptomyces sp. SID5785]|uniref:glycerophosphoryl diester phosphodiesterase membrane domain-containing protein n=1 Tax=Streptomyces sp. SID5785 TaxID=2690309 RepID=UPI001361C609|nr:glycerophosphoryl diester phosphodiesterase membrane domain-containing protein [Streptomyces sp. SID5785]MZD09190.1 hypothetical protein [Streptomyces sp. SID5785]